MLTRSSELWARVLLKKYPGGVGGDFKLRSNFRDSWLRKAIVCAWNEVSHGAAWSIGIKFVSGRIQVV